MGRYHRVPRLSASPRSKGVNKTLFLNGWELSDYENIAILGYQVIDQFLENVMNLKRDRK